MVTLITGKQKHAIRHGSMDTIFTLSENGNLNASTRVRNRSRFRELVGGIIVLYYQTAIAIRCGLLMHVGIALRAAG